MTTGDENEPSPELRAARWEPDANEPSFRRPIPWVAIVLALFAVAGGIAYAMRAQDTKRDVLRARLVRIHRTRIGTHAGAILAFRTSVEGMITRAVATNHPDILEPGFEIESLRGKSGVYVRLRARDAASPATIASALQIMEPDAIPHCLGLTPVAMRTLYTRIEPLMEQWLANARALDDPLRLAVRIDETGRFASRDLPVLESIAASDYVLLTIIRGESRATDEVDVFVLDARTGRIRLATNTKANGYLITARIEGHRAPTPSVAALARSGATDCSIAAQARTRTGEFGAAVASGPSSPTPTPIDAGVTGD